MTAAERFPELAPFISAVKEAYRGRLHGIYLFGSRARGDQRADSDYDVAVVLGADGEDHFWREQNRLADIAYDSMLASGLLIQPIPFTAQEWSSENHSFELLREARDAALELA